jgi:DNA repair exonuclease SbcCD ATPase subunit
MSYEFTVDEIRELIAAARIFCPGFGEQQFQSIMELERRFADSGYLDTVSGLARLEKERDATCSEAFDAYEGLLDDEAQLEEKVTGLYEKLATQQRKNQQAEGEYNRIGEAIEQAKAKLQSVQTQRQREERELVVFKGNADKERERIDKELEKCRRKADVTKEEIANAAKLKKELRERGFTLELTLDLCQEFVGLENARDELAEAIKEYGVLTQAKTALAQQMQALQSQQEEQKNEAEKQVQALQSQQEQQKNEIEKLEAACHNLQFTLSQLQADVAGEQEIRRFYRRYYGNEGLLEYLASWDQIFIMRCNNPVFAMTSALFPSTRCTRFLAEKPPMKRCPHCGYPGIIEDSVAYQFLNLSAGPIKIVLGV